MTEQQAYTEIVRLMIELGPHEAYKRLKRGEGSGALPGFAAAKRAAEPGGAEDKERSDCPQSLAVSAVEAKAAIRAGIKALCAEADDCQDGSTAWHTIEFEEYRVRLVRRAKRLRRYAKVLESLLPKPESESSENAGDGKLPTDSIEAGNDSNNGTASGRRNGQGLRPVTPGRSEA